MVYINVVYFLVAKHLHCVSFCFENVSCFENSHLSSGDESYLKNCKVLFACYSYFKRSFFWVFKDRWRHNFLGISYEVLFTLILKSRTVKLHMPRKTRPQPIVFSRNYNNKLANMRNVIVIFCISKGFWDDTRTENTLINLKNYKSVN